MCKNNTLSNKKEQQSYCIHEILFAEEQLQHKNFWRVTEAYLGPCQTFTLQPRVNGGS